MMKIRLSVRNLFARQTLASASIATLRLVRAEGLEPPQLAPPEPKSGASTSSATPALGRGPKESLPSREARSISSEKVLRIKNMRVLPLSRIRRYGSFDLEKIYRK